jgi:hypothetical protein
MTTLGYKVHKYSSGVLEKLHLFEVPKLKVELPALIPKGGESKHWFQAYNSLTPYLSGYIKVIICLLEAQQ